MRMKKSIVKHKDKCLFSSPPAQRVYFDNNVEDLNDPTLSYDPDTYIESVSVFEVDGSMHKLYCQNLCLLAKLFLDHKTLYFDVSPFLFYVLTEDNKLGQSNIVGYFSKEKTMCNDYNLACIMVMPPYQRRGYGKFLISLSYFMSMREGRVCTPERPLSDMGKVSYKSYWTDVLLEALLKSKGKLNTIKEISEYTFIKHDDIIQTLSSLNLVRYWKGQYVLTNFSSKLIEDHFKKKEEASLKNPRKPLRFIPTNIQNPHSLRINISI